MSKLVAGIVLVLMTILCIWILPVAYGDQFTLGAQESSDFQGAEVISAVKPEVPEELKEECLEACCVAKCTVLANGKTKVALVHSCGCPQADDIALNALRRWKFRPARLNGKPVESCRKIKVEFQIK